MPLSLWDDSATDRHPFDGVEGREPTGSEQTFKLEVGSSPPRHFLKGKGVAIRILEPGVLDATSDLFDQGDLDTSAYQVGACLFDIGYDEVNSLDGPGG